MQTELPEAQRLKVGLTYSHAPDEDDLEVLAEEEFKRDLILAFVDRVSVDSDVTEDWRRFVAARRDEELDQIIADQVLEPDATRALLQRAFRDGAIPTTGAAITEILPPLSRFTDDGAYSHRKQAVLDRLGAFFERYFALG